MKVKGGHGNFFVGSHIANPQILGLIPQSQIRKFVPSKLLISSYFSTKTFFFADLSLGYPKIFSGIEICTENA
jgi:hypothetical protein